MNCSWFENHFGKLFIPHFLHLKIAIFIFIKAQLSDACLRSKPSWSLRLMLQKTSINQSDHPIHCYITFRYKRKSYKITFLHVKVDLIPISNMFFRYVNRILHSKLSSSLIPNGWCFQNPLFVRCYWSFLQVSHTPNLFDTSPIYSR